MTYKELLFQAYLTIDGLVECINTAIHSKDWKVDGANDPDLELEKAEIILEKIDNKLGGIFIGGNYGHDA